MLRPSRDRLVAAPPRLRLGVAGLCVALVGCGSAQRAPGVRPIEVGGPTSRIEERAFSDRPPLSVIERQGDPETAIAFASLASADPELHAAFGEVLSQRLTVAGFQTQLVAHGLGFELIALAEDAERARVATQSLLQALTRPLTPADVAAVVAPVEAPRAAAPSAMARCSAELPSHRRVSDVAELERERLASFARDRSAWAVVGDENAAAAVAGALSAGPNWPELGRVRSALAEHDVTELVRGERPTLSVALTFPGADRALGAAASLGEVKSALSVRLGSLGAGLRLRRVVATAHPRGACLRIDSDVDASPLPEAHRLAFAVQLMSEEAGLALANAQDEPRLEATALSATDPRLAARAAAYGALVEPAPQLNASRLVALTTVDDVPQGSSLEAALTQVSPEPAPLDARVRVEAGQPGVWALVTTPCAATTERAETAGQAAVLFSAAAASASRGVRLEPWIGPSGLGLVGFAERAPGETDSQAATRLGDALGQALLVAPGGLEVATARSELLKASGSEPHPLLDALLEALAPGRLGALAPRGSATSLQAASREAILVRQRELLRLPHRLAVLAPTNAGDAAFVTRALSRWLKTPDALHPSPCEGEIAAPARSELSLAPGGPPEGDYVAFRIPAKAGAEASLLVDLLNAPGGLLARTLAEPDLVGAARALNFGTSSARALVVQVSAFDGREQEALSRVRKLFERLASGGALTTAELEAALARQKSARRVAALDPRFRLVQLLEAGPAPVVDAAALRRLTAALRPEALLVARTAARAPAPTGGKTPTSR